MANRFYHPGAERAQRVRTLFGQIAPRYDLINDLQSFGLHRRWKRRVVSMAQGRPGQRALDVCCGTGDLAFGLAKAGLIVTGLDFSEPMLLIARRRAQRQPLPPAEVSKSETTTGQATSSERWLSGEPNRQPLDPFTNLPPSPEFIEGDAQHLPFPDESFDVVTVGYGLRNLADWEQGLHEMKRVARKGGRLLVLDFGKPENRLWRVIYFGYLKLFVPVLGLLVCGNPSAYAYILESLHHYPAQRGVAAKMREIGLTEVRVANFLGGVMSINYGEKP